MVGPTACVHRHLNSGYRSLVCGTGRGVDGANRAKYRLASKHESAVDFEAKGRSLDEADQFSIWRLLGAEEAPLRHLQLCGIRSGCVSER